MQAEKPVFVFGRSIGACAAVHAVHFATTKPEARRPRCPRGPGRPHCPACAAAAADPPLTQPSQLRPTPLPRPSSSMG